MRVRSFQVRLFLLMMAVLLLLQTATLIAVHIAGQRTLRRNISEELQVGGRVLERILDARGRQLSSSVRLLAADFAFREAIASDHRPTIASVLDNHGSRVQADAVFLIGLDGIVTADTTGGRFVERPFPFPSILASAQEEGEASGIVSFGGKPYQLVMVPVLAPRPIAWIAMGFVIGEPILEEVRRLTANDVSIWSRASSQALVTTLQGTRREQLVSWMDRLSRTRGDVAETITLDGEPYLAFVDPLETEDDSSMVMLLQRSIREAQLPFRRLELQIFALSSLALLGVFGASALLARGVAEPLRRLAEGAQRVERGDYSGPVEIRRDDEIGHLAGAFNDMQRAIGEREERIRYQATHDELTGLANRTLFLDRLEQAIASAQRRKELAGMIMMDLDRFKEINDTLGHHFGDDLLEEVGRRLTETLRASDSVARLGGDEFAVAFQASDVQVAEQIAQRLARALEAPFELGGVTVEVEASMGIALYPLHAEDAATLMKRADVAMYDAKKTHVAWALYEPGRDEHSLRRLAILSELRHAVASEQLELHYQPKIGIRDRTITHAEALVRWRHPVHGLMSPVEFIPLAEQSGNISTITRWVLRRAILDCSAWKASGLDLTVAVNLSAIDLFDAGLPDLVSGLLAEAELSPARLMLEITESAVMSDPEHAQRILRELKNRGVTLAIDDYGTGYSSLAHLNRLPVDELKIDKSFILNLRDPSSNDAVIVGSTIELGHNMGLRVIAEGVEDAEAWQILDRLGCDMAQGYHITPPLPVVQFLRWMAESPWNQR
ncbi:MAG TPA: EAL domain-containing protein [Thermoanaerobaculia bacterium]|nr:EAL domain-containing protein [Thermoanaerobaculia bacterium]